MPGDSLMDLHHEQTGTSGFRAETNGEGIVDNMSWHRYWSRGEGK